MLKESVLFVKNCFFGSMGSDIGQSLQGFSVYHHHPGQFPPLPPLREAIQVELEKERIRREVIMSEIARRRLLEAEVRRGLMMEKESALQRGGDGFPFGSSPRLEFDSSMRLPLSGARANGRSLEERIALSLEERLYGRYGGGGYDTMQFQRGAVDRRISEGRGKQETTFLVSMNTPFS